MKREPLNNKEYKYLQKEFGLSRDEFDRSVAENADEMDWFEKKIIGKDCDAADHLDEGGYTDEDYIVMSIVNKLFSYDPSDDDDYEDDDQ